MNKPYVLSIVGALAIGGALTGMGIALAEDEDDGALAVAESTPLAESEGEPAQRTDYDNIPGMAMGAPPESASMNCANAKACTLVFITPTKQSVKPFGQTVKLLEASEKQVVISVNGAKHTVRPGKATSVKTATVKVVGTPGSVVTLDFRKS